MTASRVHCFWRPDEKRTFTISLARHSVIQINVPISQIALPTNDVGETGSIWISQGHLHCLECIDLQLLDHRISVIVFRLDYFLTCTRSVMLDINISYTISAIYGIQTWHDGKHAYKYAHFDNFNLYFKKRLHTHTHTHTHTRTHTDARTHAHSHTHTHTHTHTHGHHSHWVLSCQSPHCDAAKQIQSLLILQIQQPSRHCRHSERTLPDLPGGPTPISGLRLRLLRWPPSWQ